jgi:hypothetical protein
MWNKVSSVLIGLFWVAVFGYLIYKGLYAVTIISVFLIGTAMALDPSSEN